MMRTILSIGLFFVAVFPAASVSHHLIPVPPSNWSSLPVRPTIIDPSLPSTAAVVAHHTSNVHSRLESRTRRFRPLLFPLTQPSPLHHGALQADDVHPGHTYKRSEAASNVGRIAWIILLLYLLATTASDYFSCALEELSEVLRLSPQVAGVTLLAFGTGAPDVFSSVAAFMSSDTSGSIGFSSVLGGALFVTTVVAGTVSLVTAETCLRINPSTFLRDVLFLLVSIGILTAIAIDGKVHLWEAIMFLCIYSVYAVAVALMEFLQSRQRRNISSEESWADPLLQNAGGLRRQHLRLHHPELINLVLAKEENRAASKSKQYVLLFYKYGIELPLALPRRLTIPVVEKERWSRFLAIASSAIAPIFLAAVWIFKFSDSVTSFWIAAGFSSALGLILGSLAFFSTENTRPPERFLLVWLVGSFVMSIAWFYVVATEMVDTLLSLGDSFQMDTSILGITVLAWGNSMSDLVTDVTLASKDIEGVEIAMSGCYAGPMFITVFGLGVSLVTACCKSKSTTLLISDDTSLFYISGFLAAGLTWSLLMLPLKGMRLSRTFGAGLVLLYSSFLVVAICYAMGWISQ